MIFDKFVFSSFKTLSNSLESFDIRDIARYFRIEKFARNKTAIRSLSFSIGVLVILIALQYPSFDFIRTIQIMLVTGVIIFPTFLLIFALIEYNNMIFKIEAASLLAVSELMGVLQTSKNLEDGIVFLKDSQYPIISEICHKTIMDSSFSDLTISDIFRKNIELYGIGKLRTTFLELLDNWEIATEIVDNFREKLVTSYIAFLDKGNKQIELFVTLYNAAGTLLPLVVIALLLISGNLNIATSTIVVIFLLLVYAGIPLGGAFNSDSNQIFDFLDCPVSPAVFSAFMGSNLLKGITYEEGLLKTAGLAKNRNIKRKEDLDQIVFSLNMGLKITEEQQQQLGEILSGKTGGYLIRLISKFKDLDSRVAGDSLTVLSQVLREEEKHLNERTTFLSSERKKMILLSIISAASLGLLTACVPMFSLVVNFIQDSGTTFIDSSHTLETTFGIEVVIIFIINIVISLFPSRLKLNNRERVLTIGDILTSLTIILTYCGVFLFANSYISKLL
ncbi:MAG: hypothetical protein ACXAEU_05200 [Candidatus Hodarchaeales archaeon]|jgi:hypothetical protein